MGSRVKHQESQSRLSDQRGQVAVLFALVFTFMFVLFAMVVDVAHLVNNKINLQLAADSAAYAGAAWQARTLNAIAAVNYRMRQDLKEFAMRVQVTHLRHNRNFPRGGDVINGAPGQADVDAFICQQAHGYISESGVRYADDTNLCRNASAATGGLPPIVVPPVIAAFDPFEAAIAAQIRHIADAADKQCAAAAHDNQDLSSHLVRVYSARSKFHEQQIGALSDFLNKMPTGIIAESENHPILKAAYESATRNLTPSNRAGFQLEVLTPQEAAPEGRPVGSGPFRFVELNAQQMNASLLYVNFNVQGDGCVGQPGFLDFDSMDAGVYKVRDVVTYFAVKASAVPNLLYIPKLWLDENFPKIEAYAAAKPFGSRIGPETGIDPLLPVTGRPGNQSRILNFSFKPGDSLGMMNRKLMALFDAYHPLNSQSRPEGNQQRGWPDPDHGGNLALALKAIHAPTVFDAIFYTVFPDPNEDNIGTDYIQPQFAKALYPDYLEAYNGQSPGGGVAQQNGDAQLQPGTEPAYYQLNGDLGRSGWIRLDAPSSGGGDSYGSYAEEGAESHGVTTAVGLPFITDATARDFGFATKELVHSGWTPAGHSGQERIGYSVKFIGLDALTGKLQVTTVQGQRPIANFPSPAFSDRSSNNLAHTIH